ncbi:MAG: YceG family protein, partial [Clostridium sp.]
MEKQGLNNLEIHSVNLDINEDIISSLKIQVCKRDKFQYNSNVVFIPCYFYRFIGIKSDEDDYYENLYKLDNELKKIGPCYKRFHEGLDKDISISLQDKLNAIWAKTLQMEIMDISAIINSISDDELFPNLSNKILLKQIKNNLKGLTEYYIKSNDGVQRDDVKGIINYIIYWINIYSADLFETFDYSGNNPKIVFYGEISKTEVFYLILLSTLGCDVLYFNPNNSGAFHEIDKYNAFSKEIVYDSKGVIKPF